MTEGYPTLAFSFVMTVAGVGAQGLARFLYSVLVGRLVGKAALGELNVLLSLTTLLVLCWPQAVGAAASKFVASSRASDEAGAEGAVLRYIGKHALVSGLALAVLGGMLAEVLWRVPWTDALAACLLVFWYSMYTYVRGLRYGRGHFASGALWDVLSAGTNLLLLLVVIELHLPRLLMVPLVVGFALSALGGWPRSRGRKLPATTLVEIRAFLRWSTIHVAASGGLLQLCLLLATPFVTKLQLGDFAAAISLATPPLLLSIAMRTSLAPAVALAFARGDLNVVRVAIDRLMRTMVIIFVGLFGIATFWVTSVLRLVYSSDFLSAAPLLVLLLLGVSVNCFNASHVWLNSTRSWGPRTLAACNVTGLVVGVLTVVLLIPAVGIAGAAIGYLAGSATSSFLASAIVWRADRMPWTALACKLAFGYGLIAGGLILVHRGHDTPASAAVVSVLFLVLWLAVVADDIKRVRAQKVNRLLTTTAQAGQET